MTRADTAAILEAFTRVGSGRSADWYEAIFAQALDHTGGDVPEAIELADAAFDANQEPPEDGEIDSEDVADFLGEGHGEQFAAQRAPTGGVSIGGNKYQGGEFIPGDVMASAAPEERAEAEGKKKIDAKALSSRLYNEVGTDHLPHGEADLKEAGIDEQTFDRATGEDRSRILKELRSLASSYVEGFAKFQDDGHAVHELIKVGNGGEAEIAAVKKAAKKASASLRKKVGELSEAIADVSRLSAEVDAAKASGEAPTLGDDEDESAWSANYEKWQKETEDHGELMDALMQSSGKLYESFEALEEAYADAKAEFSNVVGKHTERLSKKLDKAIGERFGPDDRQPQRIPATAQPKPKAKPKPTVEEEPEEPEAAEEEPDEGQRNPRDFDDWQEVEPGKWWSESAQWERSHKAHPHQAGFESREEVAEEAAAAEEEEEPETAPTPTPRREAKPTPTPQQATPAPTPQQATPTPQQATPASATSPAPTAATQQPSVSTAARRAVPPLRQFIDNIPETQRTPERLQQVVNQHRDDVLDAIDNGEIFPDSDETKEHFQSHDQWNLGLSQPPQGRRDMGLTESYRRDVQRRGGASQEQGQGQEQPGINPHVHPETDEPLMISRLAHHIQRIPSSQHTPEMEHQVASSHAWNVTRELISGTLDENSPEAILHQQDIRDWENRSGRRLSEPVEPHRQTIQQYLLEHRGRATDLELVQEYRDHIIQAIQSGVLQNEGSDADRIQRSFRELERTRPDLAMVRASSEQDATNEMPPLERVYRDYKREYEKRKGDTGRVRKYQSARRTVSNNYRDNPVSKVKDFKEFGELLRTGDDGKQIVFSIQSGVGREDGSPATIYRWISRDGDGNTIDSGDWRYDVFDAKRSLASVAHKHTNIDAARMDAKTRLNSEDEAFVDLIDNPIGGAEVVTGGFQGGKAVVISSQGSVSVSVSHPKVQNWKRTISRDADGKTYIVNSLLVIKPEHRGEGLGGQIFHDQVKAAKAAGVSYLKTHAAGGPESDFKGYAVWPKMGYDQSLEDYENQGHGEWRIVQQIQEKFPGVKTILDLMERPGGPEWWEGNGSDLRHMIFDLSDGSKSMAVFEAYQLRKAREREAKGKTDEGKPEQKPERKKRTPRGRA